MNKYNGLLNTLYQPCNVRRVYYSACARPALPPARPSPADAVRACAPLRSTGPVGSSVPQGQGSLLNVIPKYTNLKNWYIFHIFTLIF